MADTLLVADMHVEIADQHDAAVGPDAFAPPRELSGLHVALHNVHAVLLVEGDAGNLVEADNVVLTDEPALAVGHVDKHPRHRGLAA